MDFSLPSITICYKALRKNYNREFCVRKMGSEFYLYQKPENEWLKSALLLFANLSINIFYNCIGYFVLSCFKGCKYPLREKLLTQIEFKSKVYSYLRVLLITIPQIILNLVGVLSFGVLSHRANIASGDLERWALGTTKEDLFNKSRNSRDYQAGYLAPCEQPIAILENYDGKERQSFLKVIRIENRRAVFSIIKAQNDFAKSITPDFWDYQKRLITA